ncbi:aspartate--tRNA ligase, mitochondrial isoform X2 [Halyomorpha halys]|uniref:aspartate--tRNA ligase, mitochondrial isoform X2 n=1 Tax=Halyomorpha halys TaxID=286706 RepID=UPI0006D4D183|nr:aspartate--tRNA ligase, mitochondrial isoform X2 [Halyomorpha halys]
MKSILFRFYSNLLNHKYRNPFSLNSRLFSSEISVLIEPVVKSNYQRTHTCGELNSSHVGQNVTLCGWLEFQRLDRFAVLRDGYGSTQVIVPENRNEIINELKRTPLESVVTVSGVVEKRPESQIKKNMSTGEIEVMANDFSIINAVKKKLPFSIRNYSKASENLRIKHRYLDLRYPVMQKNLRERSKLLLKMRNYLINHENFVEVETPTLFKKTPGGAREYIVPTKFPGEFYSLVQSPQQLKQLLMVGGIDKYFQIARCYRDEGARPDRQPEFTQLDLEMSFCSTENIMELIEKMLFYSWPEQLQIPFARLSFTDAMKLYGTDQPDLSFKCPIFEVSELENHKEDSTTIHGVKIPQAAEFFGDEVKKELSKMIKDSSVQVAILNYKKKSFKTNEKTLFNFNISPEKFSRNHGIESGDIVFIARGEEKKTLQLLGKCRVSYLRWLRSEGITGPWESSDKGTFLWIINFPLFETAEDGSLSSVHHPFTAPHPDDLSLLSTNPLMVHGLHYDLVLDGYEVGGGSVRIHNPDLQKNILSMLNISRDSLEHLICALESGAPPHGGIALENFQIHNLVLSQELFSTLVAVKNC